MAMSKRMRRTVAAVRCKFPRVECATSATALVRFVLQEWRKAKPRQDLGRYDDARDIQGWTVHFRGMCPEDLQKILEMNPGDVRRRAKRCNSPFGLLEKDSREFLATLPGRLIKKIVQSRLDSLYGLGSPTASRRRKRR